MDRLPPLPPLYVTLTNHSPTRPSHNPTHLMYPQVVPKHYNTGISKEQNVIIVACV